MLVPEEAAAPPSLNPPNAGAGAGAVAAAGVAGLLASPLGASAGLAPKENPPAAGAAGASFFSAGFAPKENPDAAGAAGAVVVDDAGVVVLSAGLAPNENPDAAGAAGAVEAVVAAGALSAGFPNEKPDKGGLEAGVVDPAAGVLLPPSPENRPPAALPALAVVEVAPVAGLSLFRPGKENEGIALPEEGAVVLDDAEVFD